MNMRVLPSAMALGLILASACSDEAESGRTDDPVNDLSLAIAGTPTAQTQSALHTMVRSLNAEEWAYLEHASWPSDDGSAALVDPTLRVAVLGIVAGTNTVGTKSERAAGVASLAPASGGLALSVNLPHWKSYYPQALRLMQNARSAEDYASNAAVAAAFADALAGFISAEPGTPLPDPTQAADGVVDGCGKSFYDVAGPPPAPNCSAIDFCCNGEISFPSGKSVCTDFSSCRNKGMPPKLGETKDSSGSQKTPDASNNDCSLGGVADAGRVTACDCQIGYANYSKTYADPSSSTGGHWCCAAYSTGPSCSSSTDEKSTCFYVDRAPDGNGCCAALPKAPPQNCTSFSDPTVTPAFNGMPVCCSP